MSCPFRSSTQCTGVGERPVGIPVLGEHDPQVLPGLLKVGRDRRRPSANYSPSASLAWLVMKRGPPAPSHQGVDLISGTLDSCPPMPILGMPF